MNFTRPLVVALILAVAPWVHGADAGAPLPTGADNKIAAIKPGTYKLARDVPLEILEGTRIAGKMDLSAGDTVQLIGVSGGKGLVHFGTSVSGYIPLTPEEGLFVGVGPRPPPPPVPHKPEEGLIAGAGQGVAQTGGGPKNGQVDSVANSEVNLGDPNSTGAVSAARRQMVATSFIAGIDRQALVDLVQEAKQLASQGPLADVFGDTEATALVQQAVQDVHGMVLFFGDTYLSYAQLHGGVVGMVTEETQDLLVAQKSRASQMAYGLLGMAIQMKGPQGAVGLKIVQDFLAGKGGTISDAGFYDMMGLVSKATGVSMSSLQGQMSNQQNISVGMDSGITTSKFTSAGCVYNLKRLLGISLVNANGRPVNVAEMVRASGAVDAALNASINLDDFNNRMDELMAPIVGSNGFFKGRIGVQEYLKGEKPLINIAINQQHPVAAKTLDDIR